MQEKLAAIEQAIADGSYRVGSWQHLLGELAALPHDQRDALQDDISRVSRALHRRHGFVEVPFTIGFLTEGTMLVTSVLLLSVGHLLAAIVGSALLTLCLQPLLKVSTGLALGVRYDYAYLWYFEPRFKMQFGTYFCLGGASKVLLHLAGSIGTPIALWIAYLAITPHLAWLGLLALVGAVVAALMQVGAFAAEWAGVRKVGPFRLSQLTSPATAAMELRNLLSDGSSQA